MTAIAALAMAAALIGPQGRADAAGPGPVQVTTAPALTWNFKSSWANYAAEPQVAGGASLVPAGQVPFYDIEWEFESGSYDEEAHSTQLDYKGSAHWLKYPATQYGYTPPPGEPDADLLDVTVSNPQITISRDSSVLSAEVISREFNGARTLALVDYGRVELESLNVLNATPTVAGGTTSWSDIPTSLTAEGSPAFAGFYRPGQVLDPISFSYTGPGGAPDFSDHFDTEGAARLKLIENKLFIDNDTEVVTASMPWVDPEDMIAVFTRSDPAQAGQWIFEAFDLAEMKPVGQPFTLPTAQAPERSGNNVVAFDTNDDRLLYRGSGETGVSRWLRFNTTTDRFEAGTISDSHMSETSFVGTSGQKLGWDPTREQAYRVQRVSGEWQLITYKEGAGGTWTKKSYPVPDIFGAGQTTGFAQTSSYAEPAYATASDGSLIIRATGRSSTEPSNPAPATLPGAYRFVLDEADETVAVQPLPVEVANSAAGVFEAVQTAPNGQILLAQAGANGLNGNVVHCQVGSGSQLSCDPAASVQAKVEAGPYKAEQFTIDPEDGTIWYGGTTTQNLAAFAHGAFLGSQQYLERNPKGGPILAGPGHTLYVQTNDGSPSEFGGSRTWGWAKFERLGFVPTVTAQPHAQAVSLAAGEASKQVSFSATASGEPAPSVQWQEKAPDASRFTNIAGKTAPSLEVDAEAGMGGAEYRAVFANAAGTVASAPAPLGVEYAPRIGFDLADASAREGQSASFSVLAEGNPEPDITWQRRVGGFWQSIGPEDENFRIEADSLTVLETNTEQSGSLFRAKLTNSVTEEPGQSPVFSRAAKLTVTPRVQIPVGGVEVKHASLDWLGNEVMQTAPPFGGSNYFSAGVSGGNEATYKPVDGEAAIYQVSAGGEEALATYATRATHVTDGGSQLARLYGGEGKIEPDGSAEIRWHAAFSVNFYGGLVPFTIEDPELKVGADGSGELTATLLGCSSSQSNPNECTPLAAATDVVVAKFSGAQVDPEQELTVTPDYSHVAVTVPSQPGVEPQLQSGPEWGSWPQSFVDFQLATGLSSYWYSSGGAADPDKPPLPFAVNFEGGEAPGSEPGSEEKPAGPGGGGGGLNPQPSPGTKVKPGKVKLLGGTHTLDGKGQAIVARLSCPAGGAACQVIVPARLGVRIAGKRYLVVVLSPRRIAAGKTASVRVLVPKAARRALGARKLVLRMTFLIHSSGGSTKRLAKVALKGAG